MNVHSKSQNIFELKIIHWNCFRMTKTRLYEFKLFLELFQPDIVSVQEIKIWLGNYWNSKGVHLDGKFCLPIKIKYDDTYNVNDDDGVRDKRAMIPLENLSQLKDYFSQLINKNNNHLNIQTINYVVPSNISTLLKIEMITQNSSVDKFTCPHCVDPIYKCEKKKMRHYISKHVYVLKNIQLSPNLCGWCGKNGCPIALKKASGRRKHQNWAPDTAGCTFGISFSLGILMHNKRK